MCRIAVPDLRRFIVDSMGGIGVLDNHAQKVANILIAADSRGHYSHGLNRLPLYHREVITGGSITEDTTPAVITETPAIAHLDGKNLLGAVAAEYAMEKCIEKAGNVGIGMVSMKRTNHFGIAGYYGLMAVEKDMIGMAFTNTSPLVVPTRSRDHALGTNPIAFCASKDYFHLDMATSTVALGKIEMARRLNKDTPHGWGVNKEGEVEQNSHQITGLLGLGGAEITGGYKGYGLGAMVEILCGVLSGSNFGKNIRSWTDVFEQDSVDPANLGQCFIAINPAMFSPNYKEDLKSYADMLRACKPAEGESSGPIVPGDRAKQHEEESVESIEYASDVIDQIHEAITNVPKMTKIC